MSETKWHKFPEEMPVPQRKHYLTCDKYGKLTIKRWDWGRDYIYYGEGDDLPEMRFFSGWHAGAVATNVTYWAELPDVPEEYKQILTIKDLEIEMSRTKHKAQQLKKQIETLKKERENI